jgi:uncharacterized membrane protein
MGLFTAPIDALERLLGHSPHPAVIGLPLGAFAVSNICDGLCLATGEKAYDDAARISLGIGLAGAPIAAVTGLRDYSLIPSDREPNHRIATAHAIGNAALGTLMGASYILRLMDKGRGRQACLSARMLSLTGGALSLYTAWLGGRLVEELGEAVQPVMGGRAEEDQYDSAWGRERLGPGTPLGQPPQASVE